MTGLFHSLYEYRSLAFALIRRDVKTQYAGYALGASWFLIEPVLTVAVFVFAFRSVLGVEPMPNYPLYLTIGIIHWHLLSRTLTSAPRCIRVDRDLIHAARFPRALLPIALTGVHVVEFGAAVAVLVAVIAFAGNGFWFGMLLYPFVLALYVAAILGATLTVASWSVTLRDVRSLVRLGLHLLFWTSPILYRFERAPLQLQRLVAFNPLAPFIDAFHALFYENRLPPWGTWIMMAAWAAGALGIGLATFHRRDALIPEVI